MYIRIIDDHIADLSYEAEEGSWIEVPDIDTDKGTSIFEHTDVIPENYWLQRVEGKKAELYGCINIEVPALGRKYNFNKTTRELFVSNFNIRCVAMDSTFSWDDFSNTAHDHDKNAGLAILAVAESYLQAVFQASKLDKDLIRSQSDYSSPNLNAIPAWWSPA